jgi:hypothetical protein
MRRVKSRSAIAINNVSGDSRPLWQKGYHDHAVRAEKTCARWRVMSSPTPACGLADSLGDYPRGCRLGCRWLAREACLNRGKPALRGMRIAPALSNTPMLFSPVRTAARHAYSSS